MGEGPIHKTQASRPAALIGPWGEGRDPRVELAPGPGEWQHPRLGGARGRSSVFPAGLPFPLAGFLLSPPGWDGTSHPPRIPAPPLLRILGAAAILARQVEGKSKPWLWGGARTGGPSGGRRRALPPALLPTLFRCGALRRPRPAWFLSDPGRRGGRGGRYLPGTGATTRAGRTAPGDGGAAAAPGGGVRSEPAGSLERSGAGRGGAWGRGVGRTEPPGRGGEVTGRARPWRGEGAGVGIGPGEAWGRWLVRRLGRPPFRRRRRRRPGHVVQLHQHHGGGGGAAQRQQDQDQEEAFRVPESEAIPGQRADPQRPDVGGEPHGNQLPRARPSERGPARSHAPPAGPALTPRALPGTPAAPRQATCTPTPPLHAVPAGCAVPARHARPGVSDGGMPSPLPFPPAPLASCVWLARFGQSLERRGKAWVRRNRFHPLTLFVACVVPLVPLTGCQLPVQLTGQVALACLNIPLLLVIWLLRLLKVSHPPDLLTPDYGNPPWVSFFSS